MKSKLSNYEYPLAFVLILVMAFFMWIEYSWSIIPNTLLFLTVSSFRSMEHSRNNWKEIAEGQESEKEFWKAFATACYSELYRMHNKNKKEE